MTWSTGTRLGPYEVIAPIGKGGMGEVYRAIDTRLQRAVAIKRGQGAFTERFQREARAIAALNHPHVCTLYDVGPDYLVMELVEGETLASRLQRGPIAVGEALRLGSQMADALAAAHAKGIVHRDLKPANVMLTKVGVKVLDFGLAKVLGPQADTALTTEGIAGTPAYMAPEQLSGASADQRTDIFALGLVLHEMVTGRRARVGHGDAPALHDAPERLAHVIERCLASEPDDRWQSAGDVRRELEWVARSPAPVREAAPVAPRRAQAAWLAGAVALGLVGAVAGVLGARWYATPPAPGSDPEMRTTIVLPPGLRLDSFVPLALSPDGSRLALVAIDASGTRQLYVRPLATEELRPLAGTAGARRPFFSPDGRSIGFFADGALQRVDVEGGNVLRVCPLPGADVGGAWGANDTIVVALRGRGLFRVSASGGTLERIGQVPAARYPSFLPDGRTVLYAAVGDVQSRTTGFSIVSVDGTGLRAIARLSDTGGTGAPVLGAAAEVSQAAVLPSGHIVFGQDPGFVRALPVDPHTLTPRGQVTTLGESVERGAGAGGVAFAVASNGLLVFAGTGTDHELVWVTRQGTVAPLGTDKGAYRFPSLSPDEKTIAVSANDATRTPHLWLIDVARGARTRLVSNAIHAAWAPDGQRIALGLGALLVAPVDGARVETLVPLETIRKATATGTVPYPTDWTSDGRYLLFQANREQVWRLSFSDSRLDQILEGPSDEWGATVAADRRAVAYVSAQSGRDEVRVATWPALGRQRTVSTRGGAFPRWSRDSRELFYWENRTLMAVTVDRDLGVSEPRPLFSGGFAGAGGSQSFDVASDGRFLMVKSDPRAELRQITVVQHWWAGRTDVAR